VTGRHAGPPARRITTSYLPRHLRPGQPCPACAGDGLNALGLDCQRCGGTGLPDHRAGAR